MYTLVSPWPPQRNGIADYAYEIARWTAAPLRVVTQAPYPRPPPGPHARLMDEAAFDALAPDQDIPAIYHIGNNPDHAFLIPLFLRRPGIAVLHDVSLHYLAECAEAVLPGFFIQQLRAERAASAAGLQDVWRRDGMKRAFDHQEVMLLDWLASAPAIIVHSQHAARRVRARVPGVPVHVIPHFAYLPGVSFETLDGTRRALRARWAGVAANDADDLLIVAAIGFPRRHKHYAAMLHVIATLPRELRHRILFFVVGELQPEQYDLASDIARFDVGDRVRLLGYAESATMDEVMTASDLVLNLRYPSYGESSGTLARAFGLGCAAIVTDTGAFAELPESICFKLPARIEQVGPLRRLLRDILDDRARIDTCRRAAYAYAHARGPADAARRYMELARG